MIARQMAFPSAPEQAHAAREWVAEQTGHPYTALVAAELWNAVASTNPTSVLMTVTVFDNTLRITAYGSAPVPAQVLTDVGGQILSTLADRHGTAPDGCGLYADLRQP